jgi:hypothetical protein
VALSSSPFNPPRLLLATDTFIEEATVKLPSKAGKKKSGEQQQVKT